MADIEVRPRELVPSEREHAPRDDDAAAAATEPAAVGGTAGDETAEPERWAAIRRGLRDVNPRRVTAGAPMLPMIVLSLSAFIAQWDDQALGLLLPDMRADFEFDLQFLFALQSFVGVVTLGAAPVIGYVADRVKRVWMIRIGGLIANGASVAIGSAHSIPHLVLGRAALDVGATLHEPAGLPLIADIYPSKTRARVIAFIGVAGSLGGLSGPIIGGNLGVAYGWRVALIALGSLSLGVTLLTFLLREPARGRIDRIELGDPEPDVADRQPPVSWSESWRAAGRITTVRRLWFAAPFIEAAMRGGLLLIALYYAEIFGLDARARGTIVAINYTFGTAALLASGVIADRILARKPGRLMTVLAIALTFQAVATIVVAFSPWLGLSVVFGLPQIVVQSLFLPALFTLLSLAVPARFRGLGMQSVAPWRLAGLLMLPFIGLLADAIGIRGAMMAMAPFYLIGAAILGSASGGVARDIRNARTAALAARDVSEAGAERPMLVCRDVDVHYDGVQVLFGVDLDVADGEIVALLGTNGAGKSTLLRAIAGVTQASGGAILVAGRDTTHAPPHQIVAGGVAMVPGGRGVFPSLSVGDNLRAALWSRGTGSLEGTRSIDGAFELFPELRERIDHQAGTLSGGEQQMVALAQAFLAGPKLLLVDELSLGLAPAVVERLLAIIREIAARGTTILLVEQSLNVALAIAQRAVFMEKGRIVFDGPAAELEHRGDVVRSIFLGGAVTGAGPSPTAAQRRRAAAAATTAGEDQPILIARDLHVRFGGVDALRGATIHARAGEIVGIIGPNGAGKTTLFDALSGMVAVQDGVVLLEGADIARLAPDERARLGLGRSFQSARLFPTMTVRETILVAFERTLGARRAALAAAWLPPVRREERRLRRRVESLITLLGLEPWAGSFLGELSTATRRIVDIGCVMASAPRVLLLDEPSSGLSQAEAEELGPLLQRLVRETNTALVLIEHDIPLVTSVSDRMIAMRLGEVIADGHPSDVVRDPAVLSSYLAASGDVIARSGRRTTTEPPDPDFER